MVGRYVVDRSQNEGSSIRVMLWICTGRMGSAGMRLIQTERVKGEHTHAGVDLSGYSLAGRSGSMSIELYYRPGDAQ
jgi:hypothetical protein